MHLRREARAAALNQEAKPPPPPHSNHYSAPKANPRADGLVVSQRLIIRHRSSDKHTPTRSEHPAHPEAAPQYKANISTYCATHQQIIPSKPHPRLLCTRLRSTMHPTKPHPHLLLIASNSKHPNATIYQKAPLRKSSRVIAAQSARKLCVGVGKTCGSLSLTHHHQHRQVDIGKPQLTLPFEPPNLKAHPHSPNHNCFQQRFTKPHTGTSKPPPRHFLLLPPVRCEYLIPEAPLPFIPYAQTTSTYYEKKKRTICQRADTQHLKSFFSQGCIPPASAPRLLLLPLYGGISQQW